MKLLVIVIVLVKAAQPLFTNNGGQHVPHLTPDKYSGDVGSALFLTPYIEAGQIEQGTFSLHVYAFAYSHSGTYAHLSIYFNLQSIRIEAF